MITEIIKVIFLTSALLTLSACKPTITFTADKLSLGTGDTTTINWSIEKDPTGYSKIDSIELQPSMIEVDSKGSLEVQPLEDAVYSLKVNTTNLLGEKRTYQADVFISVGILVSEIVFADANLKSCVDEQATTFVDEIESLYCPNRNITDLTGLGNLSYLTTLILDNNPIEDFSSIASLNELDILSLFNTNATQLNFLPEPAEFTYLELSENPLTEVQLPVLSNSLELFLQGLSLNSLESLYNQNGGVVIMILSETENPLPCEEYENLARESGASVIAPDGCGIDGFNSFYFPKEVPAACETHSESVYCEAIELYLSEGA